MPSNRRNLITLFIGGAVGNEEIGHRVVQRAIDQPAVVQPSVVQPARIISRRQTEPEYPVTDNGNRRHRNIINRFNFERVECLICAKKFITAEGLVICHTCLRRL